MGSIVSLYLFYCKQWLGKGKMPFGRMVGFIGRKQLQRVSLFYFFVHVLCLGDQTTRVLRMAPGRRELRMYTALPVDELT